MKWKRPLLVADKAQQAERSGAWAAARPWLLRLSPLLALGASICVASAIFHQPVWVGGVIGTVLAIGVLANLPGRFGTDYGSTGICKLPEDKLPQQCRYYSATSWKGGCVWREGDRCMCHRH